MSCKIFALIVNNCNLHRSYFIFFIIFILSCKQNPSTTPPIEFESFPKKTYVRDDATGDMITTMIDTSDFHSSENCYQCHSDHVDEWNRSMHSYAMRDPIFFDGWYEERLKREHTGERFCIQCHSPVAYLSGVKLDQYSTVEGLQNDPELSMSIKEGVTCTVCHSMTGISQTTETGYDIAARADYHMNPGAGIMYGPLELEPIECVEGAYCHDVKYNSLFRFSESCLPCHDMTVRGKEVESTVSEWKEIPQLAMGGQVPCQACHMPIKENGYHSHEFIGVDIDLTRDIPADSLQYKSVEGLLQNSVELTFSEIMMEASKLSILISIESLTGHSMPSGTSFSREAWLETVVTDVNKDSILFSSGTIEGPTSNLDHSDSDLLLYTSNLLDAGGNIITSVTDAFDIDRQMLSGLDIDEHLYEIDGVFNSGTLLNVSSKMHFRAFKPDLLTEVLLIRQPVFVMENIDTTFTVP